MSLNCADEQMLRDAVEFLENWAKVIRVHLDDIVEIAFGSEGYRELEDVAGGLEAQAMMFSHRLLDHDVAQLKEPRSLPPSLGRHPSFRKDKMERR